MNTMILLALLLLLLHVWFFPLVFSMKHTSWLLGARDEPVDFSLPALRAKRAAANYLESLPAFLALVLLAKIDGVDLGDIPLYWLALRVVYVGFYLAGTPVIRSLVWMGSLICLVLMALAFV